MTSNKVGFTFSFFPLIFCGRKSSIYYPHPAIITQRVFSGYSIQSTLKGMIKPSDLIPFPQILI